MLNVSIGQTVLELRKAKGATQEELANAVGISAQAVSKWENGGTPDTELLPAIADYFNVPIDRLFGRTTHPNLSEAVTQHVRESGSLNGALDNFDKVFNIHTAAHMGLQQPSLESQVRAGRGSHLWSERGYSLLTANRYGNVVTREFWESVNLETAAFARDLFALLAEPGMLRGNVRASPQEA